PDPGTLEYDLEKGKYQHRWDDWDQFQAWITKEQKDHCFELRLEKTYPGLPAFERQLRYVCSR
ncbi:hypothetical protein B0H14DRAFT_2298882, partial [Mycena olivaceomarginata]